MHQFCMSIFLNTLCIFQFSIPVFVCHQRKTRQAMHIQCNNEACSCNHCFRGKAVSIAYSECVFIALGIQYGMRMGHIVICGLRASIMFPHYLIKGKIFGKKSEIIGHKTCVLISSKNLFETFLTLRRTERDMVKCLAVFMKSARYSCPI